MSDSVEPDAWKWRDNVGVDQLSINEPKNASPNYNEMFGDEPLFSAETINNRVMFEKQARDIEDLARKIEASINGTINREDVLELVNELHEKADEIAEKEEVFSE